MDPNESFESAAGGGEAPTVWPGHQRFCKRRAWAVYEAIKRRLQEMNLPPADYERMVQKLAAFLGI